MAVGANISYPNQNRLRKRLARCLGQRALKNMNHLLAKRRLCIRKSNTAPQSANAPDNANAVGDICLHFNAANVFQSAYIATVVSTTTTWVRMQA